MKLRIFATLGMGFLIGVFLLQVAAGNQKSLPRKENSEPEYAVRAKVLKPVKFRPSVEALAEVISPVRPHLSSEVGARVVWIHPKLQTGFCAVGKQVLIRLEDRDFQLSLQNVQARIQNLQQDLMNLKIQQTEWQTGLELAGESLQVAERELQRQEDLVKKQSAPEGSVDALIRARNSVKAEWVRQKSALERMPHNRLKLQSQIRALEAEKEQLELDLSRTKLHFEEPVCVTKRRVEIGQRVEPGRTLVEAVQDSQLQMVARFPEFRKAKSQGPAPGWEVLMHGAKGRVLSVSPGLNPITRAREAIIQIQGKAMIGQVLRVQMLGAARKAIVVPAALIQQSSVLVLQKNQRIAEKQIQTGAVDRQNRVEILSGLEPGELLIQEARAAAPVGALARVVRERK